MNGLKVLNHFTECKVCGGVCDTTVKIFTEEVPICSKCFKEINYRGRVFKSKDELVEFINRNTPFAVKPQRKSKYAFVNPWKTIHGKRDVLMHIVDKLWIRLISSEHEQT